MEEKYKLILSSLNRQYEFDHSWARSIGSANSLVNDPDFDVIILDMVFAPRPGSRDQDAKLGGLAGLEILQFMTVQLVKTPVVVVTAHDSFVHGPNLSFESTEELQAYLERNFASVFRGLVKLGNSDAWIQELYAKLDGVWDE
jgi:CheY-like chemotaxis protein